MSRAGEHEEGRVLRLVHHHPGRLRLRSPAFVDSDAAALPAREALLSSGAVLDVAHDERTGSLLVVYAPGRIAPDTLAALAAEATGLRLAPAAPDHPERSIGGRIIDAFDKLNTRTLELTGSRVDLRFAVPATLAGLSVVVLVAAKETRVPRWESLAYWSINFFILLHAREVAAGEPVTSREQEAP